MNDIVKQARGAVTPKSDTAGVKVTICAPNWFDEKKKYRITTADARTKDLEFPGTDLNYMARVLYAEASGSGQLPDKEERMKEKAAILNVKYFRLNRYEYPNRRYIAKTFREVCDAPGQFESVFAATPKFKNTEVSTVENLNSKECGDLDECLAAIDLFLKGGPTEEYLFDNFRGYNPNGKGTSIGRSRFWLSPRGKELHDSAP